jgi:competence protein ComEC
LLENGRVVPTLVYKAGHHGAETAATPPFLAALQPRFVVISAAAGNREGLPHPDTLGRLYAAGTAVLRTDELGTISVASDGKRLWWQAGP